MLFPSPHPFALNSPSSPPLTPSPSSPPLPSFLHPPPHPFPYPLSPSIHMVFSATHLNISKKDADSQFCEADDLHLTTLKEPYWLWYCTFQMSDFSLLLNSLTINQQWSRQASMNWSASFDCTLTKCQANSQSAMLPVRILTISTVSFPYTNLRSIHRLIR